MENELIDVIKNELNGFELEYREGAWEGFYTKRKRKRFFFISFKRLATAAVVVMATLLLLLVTHKPLQKKQEEEVVKQVPFKNMPFAKVVPRHPDNNMINRHRKQNDYHTSLIAVVHGSKTVLDTLSAEQLRRISPMISDTFNNCRDVNFMATLPIHLTNPEYIRATEQLSSRRNPGFFKRWQLGLSFGNGVSYGQAHQFGAGAFATYKLTSKLAFSSGFYFNQLGALKDVAHGNNLPDQEKVLTNVSVNLGGLEVPLELKYNLSRRFYTKFGTSFYSIKSQQQKLFFVQARNNIVNYVDPGGTAFSETSTVTNAIVQLVPPSQLEKNKFISIYNFSIGYEYPILHGQKLFIEPFIKLPNKQFSAYKVNLAQTGLRLNVSF